MKLQEGKQYVLRNEEVITLKRNSGPIYPWACLEDVRTWTADGRLDAGMGDKPLPSDIVEEFAPEEDFADGLPDEAIGNPVQPFEGTVLRVDYEALPKCLTLGVKFPLLILFGDGKVLRIEGEDSE